MIEDTRLWAFNDAVRQILEEKISINRKKIEAPLEIQENALYKDGVTHYINNIKEYGVDRDWQHINPDHNDSWHKTEISKYKNALDIIMDASESHKALHDTKDVVRLSRVLTNLIERKAEILVSEVYEDTDALVREYRHNYPAPKTA